MRPSGPSSVLSRSWGAVTILARGALTPQDVHFRHEDCRIIIHHGYEGSKAAAYLALRRAANTGMDEEADVEGRDSEITLAGTRYKDGDAATGEGGLEEARMEEGGVEWAGATTSIISRVCEACAPSTFSALVLGSGLHSLLPPSPPSSASPDSSSPS